MHFKRAYIITFMVGITGTLIVDYNIYGRFI